MNALYLEKFFIALLKQALFKQNSVFIKVKNLSSVCYKAN